MMTAMSVKATPRPKRGREVLSAGGEVVVVIVVALPVRVMKPSNANALLLGRYAWPYPNATSLR